MNRKIEVNYKKCMIINEEIFIVKNKLYKKIKYVHKSNGKINTVTFKIGEKINE